MKKSRHKGLQGNFNVPSLEPFFSDCNSTGPFANFNRFVEELLDVTKMAVGVFSIDDMGESLCL